VRVQTAALPHGIGLKGQGDLVMDFATTTTPSEDRPDAGAEQRAAPRFTLLIRAVKLVSTSGEFVCVIRDVSETGVSVRLFHDLPQDTEFELHMPGGAIYDISSVWQRGNEAGFTFDKPVNVDLLVNEASDYPKRGLRLHLSFPVTLTTLTQRCRATVENFSQQGALMESDGLFAIDQTVRVEGADDAGEFKEIRAKVRWRRGQHYGLVFDDTFTLGDFARLAAHLQAPYLAHR
jgi:hypothetical protein